MSFDPTDGIPEHFKQKYRDAFQATIQQEQAKLANVSIVESAWTAKQFILREGQANEWRVDNTRFGKTNAVEFQGGFRSGFKQDLEAQPIKFDRKDAKKLDTIALPTGFVLTEMRKGLGRIQDDLFIAAATANALGGAAPHVTPQTFPTSQIIPVNYTKPGQDVGSNSGLTVWKALEIRTRFKQLEIDADQEDCVLAVTPEMITQLMLDAEAASNGAWAKIVLKWVEMYMTGSRDSKLLGMFRVIESNRLAEDSITGVQTALAFCKRGFVSAPLMGMESHIDVLPTDKHAIQITAYGEWGCFRAYDEMVLQVPCDPSP